MARLSPWKISWGHLFKKNVIVSHIMTMILSIISLDSYKVDQGFERYTKGAETLHKRR